MACGSGPVQAPARLSAADLGRSGGAASYGCRGDGGHGRGRDGERRRSFRLSQMRRGLQGVAYTVFEGVNPEPMQVEILGVSEGFSGAGDGT